MRLTNDNDDDSRYCPHCGVELSDFALDVSDEDCQDGDRDIARVTCPKCQNVMALIRTHSYHLAKFMTPKEG